MYVLLYLAFFSLSGLFTGNYLLNLFKVAQNQVPICCRKLLDFHLSQVKKPGSFHTPSHLTGVQGQTKPPCHFLLKNNS